jgi:phosphatidylglycerophosphate synthase
VLRVQTGPLSGFVGTVALLGAVAATDGLGPSGWVAGLGCAAVVNTLLARSLVRHGVPRLGPADRVTLLRAILVAGVAALMVGSFTRPVSVPTLVTLSAVALVLDAVDGWVARRTRTASRLGARFDMEVDAFLILALSVYVGRTTGWWVLAIGAARYAFVAAGWVFPWLRGSLPARHWCKVVAAVQGIVLTLAAADLLPGGLAKVALAVALALLTESFGREAWGLWRASAATRGEQAELAVAGVAGDG